MWHLRQPFRCSSYPIHHRASQRASSKLRKKGVGDNKTHWGSNHFLCSGSSTLMMPGNMRTMLRPSSMIGVWQYAQLTLHGSRWCVCLSWEL